MAFINVIPEMTSNTTPSGVASTNSAFEPANEAYAAMDRDSGTTWSTTTSSAYIQYQFATAQTCVKYSITANYTVTFAPYNWTLEASNTGAFSGEEVTLDTQTTVTFSSSYERKEFSFTNSTAYTYYRIDVTSSRASIIQAQEIEFIAVAPNVSSLTASATVTGSPLDESSALTASATVSAKAKPFIRSALTSSATLGADGEKREYGHLFTFSHSLQVADTTKTFKFIHSLEQPSPSVVIERIHS